MIFLLHILLVLLFGSAAMQCKSQNLEQKSLFFASIKKVRMSSIFKWGQIAKNS